VIWFLVGIQVAFSIIITVLMIRWRRLIFQAGYFEGVSNELFTGGVRQRLYMRTGEVLSLTEEKQIMAQQIAKNDRLELPDEWPHWDGIDRIALYTDEV
jgi:hypothetical protein